MSEIFRKKREDVRDFRNHDLSDYQIEEELSEQKECQGQFTTELYSDGFLGMNVKNGLDLNDKRVSKRIDNFARKEGLTPKFEGKVVRLDSGTKRVANLYPSHFSVSMEENPELYERIGKEIYGLTTSRFLAILKRYLGGIKSYLPRLK